MSSENQRRQPALPVKPSPDDKVQGQARQPVKPELPPAGSKDDPASDENTASANHPNDE